MANIIGENTDDSLVGGAEDDNINGSNGNDTLSGMDGNDTLIGGEGTDALLGGAGNDTLYIGSNDLLTGGAGRDLFIPNLVQNYYGYGESRITDFTPGEDRIDLSALGIPDLATARLFLSSGNDGGSRFLFRATNGVYVFTMNSAVDKLTEADFVFATPRTTGALILGGYAGEDILGGAGHDTIDGGQGDDRILAGAGNDRIIVRDGYDSVTGGTGNDTYVLLPSASINSNTYLTITDFTLGQDRVDLSAFGISSWDALKALVPPGVAGTADTNFTFMRGGAVSFLLKGVNYWTLSERDFIFAPGDAPREIFANQSGYVFGGTGNDRLHGSYNGSTIFGDAGDDIIYAAIGGVTSMTGGAGRDIFALTSATGFATAIVTDFTQGQDRIDVSDLGISSFDVLRDMMLLSPAGRTIQISSSNLTLNIDWKKLTAADFIFAPDLPARQISTYGSSTGFLVGGSDNDTLIGSVGSDRLFGGAGDDRLQDDPYEPYGNSGGDVWVGGLGRDTFVIQNLYGRDVIADFTQGADKLDLSALGISSLETVRYMADHVRVAGKAGMMLRGGATFDVGSIALGVDPAKLTAADLILATQTTPVTREATGSQDVIGGTAGDTLRGNANANRLFGDGGDDTLTGGAGDDRLYGGSGTDTANFSGLYADYEVTTINGITTVRHKTGSDGTDLLVGVERLAFLDQTVNVAPAEAPFLTMSGSYGIEGDRGVYMVVVEGKIEGSVQGRVVNTDAVFTINLSRAATEAVTFDFSHATSTGFQIGTRSYTIAAGQTSLEIRFPYAGNTTVAADYTLIGTVSNVRGALVQTSDGTMRTSSTILNDDFQADFSVAAYRALNTSLDTPFAGDDAGLVQHYISTGRTEGRLATGFDAEAYAAQNKDVFDLYGLDAKALLTHYQTNGMREGRVAEGFDAVAYAALNKDVFAAYGLDHRALVQHYILYGEAEGRLASGFDAEAYAALNPDLFYAFGLNEQALVNHYVTLGYKEGRAFTGFSAEAYAAFNSDVFAAFGLNREALVRHYVQNGAAEGRQTFSLLGLTPNAPAELSTFTPDTGWGPDSFL